MSESEVEVHHSFASLKRRFEQNKACSGGKPESTSSSSRSTSSTNSTTSTNQPTRTASSASTRSSPTKYQPREGTVRKFSFDSRDKDKDIECSKFLKDSSSDRIQSRDFRSSSPLANDSKFNNLRSERKFSDSRIPELRSSIHESSVVRIPIHHSSTVRSESSDSRPKSSVQDIGRGESRFKSRVTSHSDPLAQNRGISRLSELNKISSERKGSIPSLKSEAPIAQPRRGSFPESALRKPERKAKPGLSKMSSGGENSDASERMAAKKQAMMSRMAEMDSGFTKPDFPDFPGSKMMGTSSGGFLHNTSSMSQQKTVTKISGSRTVIQNSTTRKVSSTSSTSSTSTTSQKENVSSSSSSSVTSTTTSSQVVRKKIQMSSEVQRSASPEKSDTGWLFKEGGSNRQDLLTQAMHSRKQQQTTTQQTKGATEGDDEQIFDDVIIKRDPGSKVEQPAPVDDYYIQMENEASQDNKRPRPVPAPRPKDAKTLPAVNKPGLAEENSQRSASLPVVLTNGRSRDKTRTLPDTDSDGDEQRYEPVQCWHQNQEENQFSHVTKTTSQQSCDVTEKKGKARKISAFKQFKSGIINKFSSVEKREEKRTTSNLDSPDSGVESDAKVPKTSVETSMQSHQASMVCTSTADDSFESGGLEGMSDDSLHTSMMKALSLDARGRPMPPPPRDGKALALPGRPGVHSDSDEDSISGVYIDPQGGVDGGPRISPRPGVKSHMIVQASSHYSVTKDGDTQGESKHCYMELDDEGVIQRLQRSQRYQSRFGDVQPLYQDFHSVFNRAPGERLLPIADCNKSEGSAVYDIADEQPLYLTYDAYAPTYMPYFETGSSASDDVTTDVDVVGAPPLEEGETQVVREETEKEERVEGSAGSAPVMIRTASQRNSVKGAAVRKLWSEMPEVIESGVLQTLSSTERKLQEAYFEVITSEASYLKSVNILIDTFLMSKFLSPEAGNLTRLERHHIFSNIASVMETSERFLAALEARWSEHFVIDELCDIIRDHAEKYFDVYVVYCTNQIYQIRTMDKLLKKKEFREGLAALERDPRCQLLPMKSFLLLPMQRICRLPLLLSAISQNHSSKNHKLAEEAAIVVAGVVKRCNEGARSMERMEQMVELEREIKFENIKKIPLISSGRYLVKRGDLIRIISDQSGISSKIIPGRKAKTKQTVSVFLFNDLIVFSRKKSLPHKNSFKDSSTKRMARFAQSLKLNSPKPEPEPECNEFVAFDYCSRIAIEVDNITNPENDSRIPDSLSSTCKNVFILAVMENHAGKQVEMILSADSPSDQARWIELLAPAKTANTNEKVYEKWDCPVVKAAYKYAARQPDELSLTDGDEIKVTRKMGDGWYEGERIRDGRKGWFPSTFCTEVTSDHLRMKNLRQRYRVNVLSKNLLDSRQASKC